MSAQCQQKKLYMIHKGWPFTVINQYSANLVSMSDIPTTPGRLRPAEHKVPPFKRAWNTILYTDYSSNRNEFCLTQENPENNKEKHIIHCDSASLPAKQQKLPAIHEEDLETICALQQIYNKRPLDDISDEISNIVIATYRYNFTGWHWMAVLLQYYTALARNGKKEKLNHNPCEVVQIRNHGESCYIRDLETGRIYLRNRKFIKHSTLFLARVDLRRWRSAPTS